MERVAVITDLHANLPALEAALAGSIAKESMTCTAAAISSATGRGRTERAP